MKNNLNYNLNPAFTHLSLIFKPSYYLLLVFMIIGGMAIFCVVRSITDIWVMTALMLVIIVFSLHAILLHALLVLPTSIVRMHIDKNQQWHITNKAGRVMRISFHGSTFVSSFCSVVNCIVEPKHRWQMLITVMMHPRRVDEAAYRKLRILLRLTQ